jgi:soluble lytic murein transglycosylase
MKSTRSIARQLLATTLVAGSLGLAGGAHAETDADFIVAKTAFERGDLRRLDAVAPTLSGHLLYRYVRYWQLSPRLDSAAPEDVQAFFAAFPDGPLTDRLRNEWLKALGKRGDWNRFALDYPLPGSEDVELACYGVQYRYQRDGAEALAAAKPLWFTGNATPDACEPLFAALIARGDITPADRRARMRMAIASGNTRLAHAIAADLPAGERITAKEFAAVDRDPLRALAKGAFAFKSASGRELALYAVERAARKDAGSAHDAWSKWRDRLPQADRAYGNSRVAYHAARQLNPMANGWFREAKDVVLSPEQQKWRVRAALRSLAWSDVLPAIDALPSEEREEPAWRYWRARALAAGGAKDEARAVYADLAKGFDFYGLLAAEALGGEAARAEWPRHPITVDEQALAAFGAKPGVRRAVKLASLDVRLEAIREWNASLRGLDDEGLLLAAEYAKRVGLLDRAISAAERTTARHDFSLRYLTPFAESFADAAKQQDVDVALLYGIARQESRFVPDIVSSAGAVGLMQLMPGTARWVARKLAVDGYSPARIADVELNTQFGAFYFKYWQDRLDRLPVLAAAAYNAGPSRAQAWRPASGALEGAIWVETIPFNETRDYVKRVLANTMLYSRALGRPYVSLTERLGVVTPRGADNIAATNEP